MGRGVKSALGDRHTAAPGKSRESVAGARRCAYWVVRRVFETAAYADRAFASEASGLEPRERALAMQIAYGAIQRRATLDYLADRLSRRPLKELDPPVLNAIRVGLLQLLYLNGVPEHAAVNETVELVKLANPRGAGTVNAILRRAAREGMGLVAELDDSTAEAAAVLHSVPRWLAELWWSELGPDTARALLRGVNDPAESAIRVNELVATGEEVVGKLPVSSHVAAGIPEGLVLDGGFDAHGSELWRRGAIMPQSRGSMLVSRVLDPDSGQRLLDLCAAPGAKTTHLAALIGNQGQIVAVERHAGRARALIRTCSRMHADCVTVEHADATVSRPDGSFQSALVDPPCSGLGTLQSRPDLRWRTSPAAIEELAALQTRLLAAAARAIVPGGSLVYSVCTISRAESNGVVQRFIDRHPEFTLDDLAAEHPQWSSGRCVQLLPHRDGTDGFFIARMRRA